MMTPEREKYIRESVSIPDSFVQHEFRSDFADIVDLLEEIDRLRDKLNFITDALDNANGPPYVARDIVVNEHDVFLFLDKILKRIRG